MPGSMRVRRLAGISASSPSARADCSVSVDELVNIRVQIVERAESHAHDLPVAELVEVELGARRWTCHSPWGRRRKPSWPPGSGIARSYETSGSSGRR